MRLLLLPEHLSTITYFRMGYRARRGTNRAMSDVRNRFCYRLGVWIPADHGMAGSHGKALVRPQVILGELDGTRRFPRTVLLKGAYMLITKRDEAPPRRCARPCGLVMRNKTVNKPHHPETVRKLYRMVRLIVRAHIVIEMLMADATNPKATKLATNWLKEFDKGLK